MNKNIAKIKKEKNSGGEAQDSGNEIKTGRGFYFKAPPASKPKKGLAQIMAQNNASSPSNETKPRQPQQNQNKSGFQGKKKSAPEKKDAPSHNESTRTAPPAPNNSPNNRQKRSRKNRRPNFADKTASPQPPAGEQSAPPKQQQPRPESGGKTLRRQENPRHEEKPSAPAASKQDGGTHTNQQSNKKNAGRKDFHKKKAGRDFIKNEAPQPRTSQAGDASESEKTADEFSAGAGNFNASEFSNLNINKMRTGYSPRPLADSGSEAAQQQSPPTPEEVQPQPAAPAEPAEEKIEIVGVRFKPVGKIYYFDPCGEKYTVNEKIIVETSRGFELGYIAIANRMVGVSKIIQPLKSIQRRAGQQDLERAENNKKLVKEAIAVAVERVREYGPKLKIIDAEYTFDNTKLIYYFTSESRVDFRELARYLASIFKIRIELRQIGIRDLTKVLGGLSICGRPFCCSSFLPDLEQITIKMAKEQNISINSAKISGACGKLMCCLRYEQETYEALAKDMPKVNSLVETSAGETGTVIEANVLTGMCKVKLNPKQKNAENVTEIKQIGKKDLKVIGFLNTINN